MWGRPMPGELCKGIGPGEIDLDFLSIRSPSKQMGRRRGSLDNFWAGRGPIMTTQLLRIYRSLPGHLGAVRAVPDRLHGSKNSTFPWFPVAGLVHSPFACYFNFDLC